MLSFGTSHVMKFIIVRLQMAQGSDTVTPPFRRDCSRRGCLDLIPGKGKGRGKKRDHGGIVRGRYVLAMLCYRLGALPFVCKDLDSYVTRETMILSEEGIELFHPRVGGIGVMGANSPLFTRSMNACVKVHLHPCVVETTWLAVAFTLGART